MLNCNYLVAEGNGGLWLFILGKRDDILHAYTNFEYAPGSLMDALHELEISPEAYATWDNDVVELHGFDVWYCCKERGMNIINYNGGIHPRLMGSSAISEFSLNDKIIPCSRVYIYSKDIYIHCDSIKYDSEFNELYMYDEHKVAAIMGVTDGMTLVAICDNKMTRYGIEGGMCYEIF